VISLAIGQNETKWVGTMGDHDIGRGLSAYDGYNWIVYTNLHGGNHVSSLAIAIDDTKWVGTYGGGLMKFNDTTWTVYDNYNSGLPHNWVEAINIDQNDTKWIGTYQYYQPFENALTSFDGSKWTVYDSANSGLPGGHIESIAIDKNGTKWIGTTYGLAEFDGYEWKGYNINNSGLPGNSIRSIVIDENGTKWIGTSNGLAAYNQEGIPSWAQDTRIETKLLNIYPNPATDIVQIELYSKANISIVELINLQGKVIKKENSNTNHKIKFKVSDIPKGFYLIRIHTKEHLYVKKLILE